MSQHDFNIANQSFPATRTDLNNALQALASNSSGDAEPSTTFANQWWYETDTNTLKLRNEANNAWLSFATVDQSTAAWTLAHDVDITGTATVTGVLTANGGAVFNESGADVDFRVESDTDANALFVEGSSGKVGIGTSSPDVFSRGDSKTLGIQGATTASLGVNAASGSTASIYVGQNGVREGQIVGASGSMTINAGSSNYLSLGTDFTERMRIDSSGNVGIGTSSPTSRLHIYSTLNAVQLIQSATTSGAFTEYKNGTSVFDIGVNNSAGTLAGGVSGAYGSFLASAGAYPLAFGTNGTERMRIDSSGDLSVGHAGGLGPIRISAISTVADWTMYLRNDHATTPYGIYISYLTAQNDTGSQFLACADGGATRFSVASNGGLANYQANDSNLSDELEKNQFGQLDSTSDCVRSWEIVKYLYKDEDQTNPHKYGVIAQQIEEHCPEVITNWVKVKASDEVLWSEEDNDIPEGVSVGDVKTEAVEQVDRMAVKEQQMFWMLVKSHQEALNKIDAMEIRLSALEG